MSTIAPPSRSKGPFKGGTRRDENNRIYANPLPIIFSNSPPTPLRSVLGLLGLSLTAVINPHCEGIFDPTTRSVWVFSTKDSKILWQRGFFGKGSLSRSEPSWFVRQQNNRQAAGKQVTSEEVTAKRREERRQFKLDRAAAIAAAAAEAEQIYATEGRVIIPALSGPSIPSAATWRPAPALTSIEPEPSPDEGTAPVDLDPLEDVEHLQLTLQEAFFLAWNLDCLTVFDQNTGNVMSLKQIWIASQNAMSPVPPLAEPVHFDNPFLINYVVYHHYRSLGWVVRGGIKFCVDYLLYKRGPVFTHAEFALVVCPVYEDPKDREKSSFDLQNVAPFSWTWLSTVNRVNTQVQKTLMLVYVTIPARSRLPVYALNSPSCLQHFTIREVTLRRFVPARMRE